MHGLMMHKQLLISSLIEHADRHHGDTQIVSRRVEGDIHRYTFRDCHRRARHVASALTSLGVQPADRIGTLAWMPPVRCATPPARRATRKASCTVIAHRCCTPMPPRCRMP
jgi:acyl-CoA synthetase (AMP-forming)/AMP-acid ligase II